MPLRVLLLVLTMQWVDCVLLMVVLWVQLLLRWALVGVGVLQLQR